MIGTVSARVGLGLALGLAFGWLHLYLLRRAVERTLGGENPGARQAIMRGLPVRMLLWAPAAIIAGRAGLPGCIGLLVGMAVSRWLYWRNVVQPS